MWEYLKANKIKCVSSNTRKASKKLFSYGSNQPLQVAGIITAEVSVGVRVLSGVEFVVIENKGQALLGRETAVALRVLKLGIPVQVNSLGASTDGAKGATSVLVKLSGCCEGIGRLKNFSLKGLGHAILGNFV